MSIEKMLNLLDKSEQLEDVGAEAPSQRPSGCTGTCRERNSGMIKKIQEQIMI